MEYGKPVANQNQHTIIRRLYNLHWKCYEYGAPWKKQHWFLIDGAPEISKIKNF